MEDHQPLYNGLQKFQYYSVLPLYEEQIFNLGILDYHLVNKILPSTSSINGSADLLRSLSKLLCCLNSRPLLHTNMNSSGITKNMSHQCLAYLSLCNISFCGDSCNVPIKIFLTTDGEVFMNSNSLSTVMQHNTTSHDQILEESIPNQTFVFNTAFWKYAEIQICT